MSNHSIHHVTAVTANIAHNLEFYTKTLGLRLVKKSVNQDDVSAYHLFYADAVGSPGTDMTFFDWPKIGPNVPGGGAISLTSFRVDGASLDWWESRLEAANALPQRVADSAGREAIQFADPEGQRLELIDDRGWAGESTAWAAYTPTEFAIRGIVGVNLESARPEATVKVLTDLLGYRRVPGPESFYETSEVGAYGRVRVLTPTARRVGHVGAGGVHHVAFRVSGDDELDSMRKKIEAAGLSASGFVDRFYFHSLYFREPGGILFELATDGPGFAADEDASTLGQNLALPPFLESRRIEIEAGLTPLFV